MNPALPATPALLRVCGIAGSLRSGSYNRALLRAAAEVAPGHIRIAEFDLSSVPPYNADVEAAGAPEAVAALKRAIRSADALIIATPEYNSGVPGVLKNALDWASRPPRESALIGKPTAMMGATPGSWGTARSQVMLRQVLAGTLTPTLLSPEIYIARAAEKFDSEGRLIDETTREYLRKFLLAFEQWARTQPRK
jgi:chromate reductase